MARKLRLCPKCGRELIKRYRLVLSNHPRDKRCQASAIQIWWCTKCLGYACLKRPSPVGVGQIFDTRAEAKASGIKQAEARKATWSKDVRAAR